MRTPEQKAKHAERERQRRAEHPDRYAEYGRRQRAAVAADPERAARRREYQRQYQAEYRSAHPEQRSAIRRRSEMVKRVGITPERYDEMVAEREGRCDICGKAPEKRLCIDHDHRCCNGQQTCGECVRGLLCNRCNRAIGLLGDDPAVLAAAIAYLGRWERA